MLRAIKYELNPTNAQKDAIRQTCGCCRLVYNTMLDRKISAYKENGTTISAIELINQLPELKSEKTFLKDAPSQALQQAIRNLDTAYTNFFRKGGSGFPKFKKKGIRDSFRIPIACTIDYGNWTVKIAKLGTVRFFKGHNKQIKGKIKSYTVETKCLHQEDSNNIDNAYGAISFPIYQTATFAHRGVGESTGYDYSRLQNPTREQLEKTVASLEKGIDAIAFSSGMSAIAAVMELFRPGDHVIADADLYGGSVRLFQKISEKNGIVFSRADLSSEDVQQYITENTKAIYIETPTNPMMHVTDIRKLSEIAKAHQLLVIVDNTFMSPYFQNPLELGADIVVHSGTKYLNGHNDVIAGFTVTADQELAEKLRFIFKTTGACLAPFDSWLVLRGIKTLALRMEKAQENVMKLTGMGGNGITVYAAILRKTLNMSEGIWRI